uniref:Beta-galactosidase-1-like protein 2 n=1 Tax=Magallana gigas TaxID=29159 RepID=K1PC55_MAGGI
MSFLFKFITNWLLKDPNIKVRSNYPPYVEAVKRFYNDLIPRITDLQRSNSGPIIAVQVENEFGSYSTEVDHLHTIREVGQEVMTFLDALPTANFPSMEDGSKLFRMIREWSPEFPLMVMEFWPGWFDHWGQPHKGLDIPAFEACLSGVLDAGGSFNMYMFHGGTNFGFMAGANYFEGSHYKPDVTSYDYDAPLSEAGDITPKYMRAREIILEKGLKPQGKIAVSQYLDFRTVLSLKTPITSKEPALMENLDYHQGYGQCFGYVLYQAEIQAGTELSFTDIPKDRAQVFVNGEEKAVLDWLSTDKKINLGQISGWNKGIVIVNNFNLGRYWKVGPTRTLYIPAPLLKQGQNEILIFEQHESCGTVSFIDAPLLGEKVVTKEVDSACYPTESV